MAEFVLGLAKTAVEGTINMAKSAIEEEKKLQKSVKQGLIFISDEFEIMRSFLMVTKERATTNDMMSTLVRQVRNMALDVEDCIDSVAHVDNGSSRWRHMLPSCVLAAVPLVALDDVVANIDLLKARVEAMERRNLRYSHISDSSLESSEQMHRQAVANATALDILHARDPIVGESSQVDLIKLINLKNDGPLQVISVWGTGSDLGTASVIKKAYFGREVCKYFTCRAWVKLMHPFNLNYFIHSLLIQFHTNYDRQGSTMDALGLIDATESGLITDLINQLRNQRYLVILENMLFMDDWDTIRAYLPDVNNGSCIILQTQELEIASMCMEHSFRISELKRFSADHSVCVFSKEDTKKDVQSIKEKAARVWFENFERVRVGREIDLNTLDKLVAVKATDRDVVLVWGIAGAGKSSVVRQIYCSEVCKDRNSFEKFGWVNVCHPFNIKSLSRSLLLDIHSDSLQHCSMSRISDPIKELRDLLHENRCLVVIDGIESIEEWYMTKAALEIGRSGSRIIVITNEENVATHPAMQSYSMNVKVLEFDEARRLFEQKVQEKRSGSPYVATPEIDFAIIHMTGGLPRVVDAIADFFCASVLEDWRLLSDRFIHELETNQAFGNLHGLFAWVHSYFRTCPDFLKPCIFYLSIFPVDHVIRRRRLGRRWIAEGYSRDTKECTAEENTEQFFSKLVKLSVIQLLGSTTATTFYETMPLCQVNGFFREYINSRSMEENLTFSLEGRCCMNSQRTVRHLAIGRTWDRDKNVFESTDLSRLRSLTVFGQWRSFLISDKMRLLRVLDLEDSSGVRNKDLKQMLKVLLRLKYLSLRRCGHISHLPNSLGSLSHLQSLDIRDTSIMRLPKTIIKLHKLQYLRAGISILLDDDTGTAESLREVAETPSSSTLLMSRVELRRCRCFSGPCNDGVEVPGGIGKLIVLHTLGVIDISVASRGRAVLEALKNLTQLHKLGVSGINQRNSQEFFSAISDHGHLESLSVQLDVENQACLDDISAPPKNLQSLKLYGQVNMLPKMDQGP
ncbi:unnamed protein product [Urochloa humidicola]